VPITRGHAQSRSQHHRRSPNHAINHADHAPSNHETHHPYKGWVSDAPALTFTVSEAIAPADAIVDAAERIDHASKEQTP